MFSALHHLHIRKRIHQKHEVFPSSRPLIRVIDFFIYAGGIIGPFVALPQLLEIWVRKNASGISVATWTGYCVLTSFWILYGVVHKEKPIVVANIVWLFFNIAITIGAAIYQ